jgi:hypothetical protein
MVSDAKGWWLRACACAILWQCHLAIGRNMSSIKLTLIKIALTAPVVALLLYPFITASEAGVLREVRLLGPLWSLVVVAVFFSLVALYCRELQRSLEMVRPAFRLAAPRSVWLMFLIPYNFVEDFFIIANVTRSLRREASEQPGLAGFGDYGMRYGIGWCTAQILSLIPHEIGSLASVIALVLWVIHWRLVCRINNTLGTQAQLLATNSL